MQDNRQELAQKLRALRLARAYAQARALIRAQPGFAGSTALKSLLYEHEDFWWAPIVGRRVTLRRRDASDLALVRLAADHALNLENIHFTGLAANGLEYL